MTRMLPPIESVLDELADLGAKDIQVSGLDVVTVEGRQSSALTVRDEWLEEPREAEGMTTVGAVLEQVASSEAKR